MHGIFVHFKRTLYIFVRLCRINARNMLNFQQTLRLQMLTVKNSPNRILKKCKANALLLFTATARGKRQPSNPPFISLPARQNPSDGRPAVSVFSVPRRTPCAPLDLASSASAEPTKKKPVCQKHTGFSARSGYLGAAPLDHSEAFPLKRSNGMRLDLLRLRKRLPRHEHPQHAVRLRRDHKLRRLCIPL